MATIQKRGISLLLVLVLMLGMIPSVSAAEIDTQPSTEPAETTTPVTGETLAAETSPPETTQPVEAIPTETNPMTESTGPSAVAEREIEAVADETEYQVVKIHKGSKYWRLNGRDWENGISISYKLADGTSRSTNIQAINYHYIDDLSNPGYCLEPNLTAPYYNEVGECNSEPFSGIGDISSGTVGATTWNKLTADQREAIALVMLYGLPNNIPFDPDDAIYNRYYFAAGQVLVWEFVMGIRYSTWPYEYVDPDVLWSTVRPRIPGSRLADFFGDDYFIPRYYELAQMLETHWTIPSFAANSEETVMPIELLPDGTGWYTATVTDANRILEKFDFTDPAGNVQFSREGDVLTIRTQTIPADPIFTAVKEVPDPTENSYYLTYAPGRTDRQKMVTIRDGSKTEPVTAYIKLSAPVGSISGTKVTDTGTDLHGWEMQLRSGEEVIATAVTDDAGKFSFESVIPGTYTIHEAIPEDSNYECMENDISVTVDAGAVTGITVTNCLKSAEILACKVDHLGQPLQGATFLLEWSISGVDWNPVCFTDAAFATNGSCTSDGLQNGCLTSNENGIVCFSDLHPRLQYRLTEVKAPDGYQLLTEPAFEGTIPADCDLTVTVTVVNAPEYVLPMTGSKSPIIMAISLIICIAGCIGTLVHLRRKEK